MQVIKPPESLPHVRVNGVVPHSVFLAGSIEMGKATDWQTLLTGMLSRKEGFVFNPRRDDWDSSWEQTIENPNFYGQVNWELLGLDIAQVIAFYFDPTTKSPISLMELGLHAASKKCIVCCPDGFWRKGNVEIVCERYGIPLTNTLPDLGGKILARLRDI